MLFPTSAQDSPRGLPDANDLCLGLQSLSLTGWDRPWSTQDSDASAQSSTHSGGCQKMSWLGEGARGVASEDTHSNSCSVPLCIPPAQHGAFLQEMEMLLAASVQDRWLLVKPGSASPITLTDSLELLVCTWGGPGKGPQGDSRMQKRSR